MHLLISLHMHTMHVPAHMAPNKFIHLFIHSFTAVTSRPLSVPVCIWLTSVQMPTSRDAFPAALVLMVQVAHS